MPFAPSSFFVPKGDGLCEIVRYGCLETFASSNTLHWALLGLLQLPRNGEQQSQAAQLNRFDTHQKL